MSRGASSGATVGRSRSSRFPRTRLARSGMPPATGAGANAPAGRSVTFDDCRADEAAATIAEALGSGAGWLAPADVAVLLDCYGIRAPASRVVSDAAGAGRAAAEIGGRVALKAIAPGLVHKSDAGGVRIGLTRWTRSSRRRRRWRRRSARERTAVTGFLVQAMAPAGVELIVGVVQDRAFGPIVACGAGGTSAELLGDIAVRLTPLTDLDARDMLRSLKVFPLLDGYRGAPPCDIGGLEDLLLRVGALVETHPEIAEMDLNPVVALPDGPTVVDARIRLESRPARQPLPSLVG